MIGWWVVKIPLSESRSLSWANFLTDIPKELILKYAVIFFCNNKNFGIICKNCYPLRKVTQRLRCSILENHPTLGWRTTPRRTKNLLNSYYPYTKQNKVISIFSELFMREIPKCWIQTRIISEEINYSLTHITNLCSIKYCRYSLCLVCCWYCLSSVNIKIFRSSTGILQSCFSHDCEFKFAGIYLLFPLLHWNPL